MRQLDHCWHQEDCGARCFPLTVLMPSKICSNAHQASLLSSEKALPHFILLLCKDKAGIEASMHVCVAINGQNFEVCLTQRSLHLGRGKRDSL